MKTFKVETLGCKVNQFESEGIAESIIELGLKVSDNLFNADLVIINTCAITHKAARQSRQLIRKVIKQNSCKKLIVTGCYADAFSEELADIRGIDLILSNDDKWKIGENVIFCDKNSDIASNNDDLMKNRDAFFSQVSTKESCVRTRPYLKIQDGCDSFCSYCIVPYARGKTISLSKDKVFSKIKNLSSKGYKEVILTGINIGNYGKDIPGTTNLYNLIYEIINKEYIDRVRISSIEPLELSTKIIHLAKKSMEQKSHLCNHFHIPLQSGDDSVLENMKRPYNRNRFIKLIKDILFNIPNCAVGLDVIVGFPGETEEAFKNTYDLINNLEIAYLHVFPFSPRKKTLAWNYQNRVDPQKIKERSGIMRELGVLKRDIFYNRFIGKDVSVLVEHKSKNSYQKLKGITGNYLPVYFNGSESLCNTIQTLKIIKKNKAGMLEGLLTKKMAY